MPRYEGRLELTWTNKHERLLAHDDGSYEWLPASDYRVAEVRLLQDAGTVGEVGKNRAADNLLIKGDALHALTSLTKLPEFAREYVGKVKLAYIDPPFNTGQVFTDYDDALEHSVWLTMMRDRLLQVWDLLAPDGSLWVHLDDSEVAYCRVAMDEIFGRENFVATVVWETDQGRRNDTDISTVQDYLLIYARDRATWRRIRNLLPRTPDQTKRYRNPDNDPRGPWLQGDNGTARSGSETSLYPITTPSGRVVRPPKGYFWRFSQETFARALEENRVYFGANGSGMPIIKRYLTDVQDGVVPRTWWPASEVGSNMSAKRDHLRRLFPDLPAFATPKPEGLLQRIIEIATNPDDVVLDCFAGSGTTAAVAHKLGRRWVTVEWSQETVENFTSPRLRKVVENEDPGGISTVKIPLGDGLPEGVKPGEAKAAAKVLDVMFKAGALEVEGLTKASLQSLIKSLKSADKITTEIVWQGGGGFRMLEVAPSMFESDDNGLVYLSDTMSNGNLAEATAAQLGYEYKPEPPFAGLKGRIRLAVVDGVVNEDVVRLLVSALAEGERVVVCGTALDPQARGILQDLRPGSTLRKVPSALLDRYRSARRQERRSILDDQVATSEPSDSDTATAASAPART